MQNAIRRPGTITAPTRRPMKPKAWSHQDDLLAMRGREAVIIFLDGQRSVVELLEADAFAIKIRSVDGIEQIVWKHDLSSITLKPVSA